MLNKNYEIENALQTIALLKKYTSVKTETKRKEILRNILYTNLDAYTLITKQKYTPTELIAKIKNAIKLDKYRPKNLSIMDLATSKDLDYINGDFNTFDPQLSKMSKNKRNVTRLHNKFKRATENITMLAQQFSADWIRRLNNHKDLIDAARSATEDIAKDTYAKLFNVLVEDFCKEYHCKIQCNVVTDWKEMPDIFKNQNRKITNPKVLIEGLHISCTGYVTYPNMSEKEKNKIRKKFEEDLAKNNIDDYKVSAIFINITNIRKSYPDPTDFFYHTLANFIHEIHHALDYQNPRQTALGPQVELIDRTSYVPISRSVDANRASATEISSYYIADKFIKELKKSRF